MFLQSLIGLTVLCFLAWVCGKGRARTPIKTVSIGLGIQILTALTLIKISAFGEFFVFLGNAAEIIVNATREGTTFVFGYLGGGDLPFDEKIQGSSFILAFQALPLILVVSAISSLLFHWRVLPLIIGGFSWCFQKIFGVTGAVGLSAAANIFVGMIEAPLLVKPYLHRLNRAELFTVMTCGMATVAGTVMVLYATFISMIIPNAIGHLLSASIISVPAAIMIANLMEPETEPNSEFPVTFFESEIRSSMEAITRGTTEGITLILNITAMLIVMISLISLINLFLEVLPQITDETISVQRILGWIMSPIVWLIGIPWEEAQTAGALMGTKTILNEFIAYLEMSKLPEGTLSDRSQIIMTYALCGFANLGSLGIMIGGLSAMCPDRREEIVSLSMKSIVSGTLTTLLTGAVVGVLI